MDSSQVQVGDAGDLGPSLSTRDTARAGTYCRGETSSRGCDRNSKSFLGSKKPSDGVVSLFPFLFTR